MNTISKLGGEGILTEADIPSLKTQRARVLALMEDGKEHSGLEIIRVSGGSEGLRRLRELRTIPGVVIKKRRDINGRFFWYWMEEEEPEKDFFEQDEKRKQALSRLIGI